MTKILVTGGAGYIGAHCCISLLASGFEPVVIDNFSNSNRNIAERIQRITGHRLALFEGDVRNRSDIERVFEAHSITAVIHFAALKAVGDSVARPLEYYDNNINGMTNLLSAMHHFGVLRVIFSSSATVYGEPESIPLRENATRHATNPYGRTKLFGEQILEDCARADPNWRIVMLRYFNPVGAHESGLIGEDPKGTPNNLMPYVAQVATGQRKVLSVFGGDYPTPDGTGIRDYIHVMDLAEGHTAALHYLARVSGAVPINLGTGQGSSVLEMVRAFECASGRTIPYEIVDRRPGDVAECWADPSQAEQLLGWKARRTLSEMCADAWRWQSTNARGLSEPD
ncbi:UDP-glucose 4-epimerase GalE [Bosea sp. 2KB_26]|uniref:UDP-glucose 4-epimerase GalE n=1 Tax=Bosea sp. 2KB_26 TaxID=3237475 RepID=UPI000DE4148A